MTQLFLTDADEGKSFEGTVGSLFVVELEENPTTGFLWAIDKLDQQIAVLQDSLYKLGDDSGIGGGGVRRMTFAAIRPGDTPLALKLRREWEGDASILKRYNVSLKIR